MRTLDETILLLEDDDNDAYLLGRAVKRLRPGSTLVVLHDGESAIEYLAGRGAYADRQVHPLPSIVLLDVKTPRRSGLEVLQWLKRQPGLRRIPVVVLTASVDPSSVRRAYELGANSFLTKPLAYEDLTRLTEAVLEWWLDFSEPAEPTIAEGPLLAH